MEITLFIILFHDKYTVRIIIDENKNFEWDTGNYLKKFNLKGLSTLQMNWI